MMNSILQNIAALATVAICVFTAVYVMLTRKTLIHQLRPNVVVRASPDALHGRLINLEIVNFGYGAAMDVRCELIGHFLPLHHNESKMPENFGPLSSGIEFLAPNESIVVFWNQIERVKNHLEQNKIKVICRYKSQDGIGFVVDFRFQ